jgi:hypothetical protein
MEQIVRQIAFDKNAATPTDKRSAMSPTRIDAPMQPNMRRSTLRLKFSQCGSYREHRGHHG